MYLTIGTIFIIIELIFIASLIAKIIFDSAKIYINDDNIDNLKKSYTLWLLNPLMIELDDMIKYDWTDIIFYKIVNGAAIWFAAIVVSYYIWPAIIASLIVFSILYKLRKHKRNEKKYNYTTENPYLKVECLECLDVISVPLGNNKYCTCGNLYVDENAKAFSVYSNNSYKILN